MSVFSISYYFPHTDIVMLTRNLTIDKYVAETSSLIYYLRHGSYAKVKVRLVEVKLIKHSISDRLRSKIVIVPS